MLGSCHYLPDFDHTHHASRIGRAVQPAAALGATLGALRTAWEACRDGLDAHRHYEHLRSRGVPHEKAIREALGVGQSRSPRACGRAMPLWFAGKA
jgi:hypothetical protein